MGRIRTIKPEFHKHEELSALPEGTHLLAAALLNYADDEGYFNAHPGLVKAECCPLREPSVTVPVMLQQLSAIGYLDLGTGADGKRYGRVAKFAGHQVISHPKPSKLKAVGITWDASRTVPVIVQEPSSLNGIEGNREQGIEGEGDHAPDGAAPGEPIVVMADDGLELPLMLDRSEPAEATRRWNLVAVRIKSTEAQILTATRRKKFAARLKECGGLGGWEAALAKVEASSFLCGGGPRGWRVDLDFLLQQKSFTKLMEGGFDDRPGAGGANAINAAFEKLYAEAAVADAA